LAFGATAAASWAAAPADVDINLQRSKPVQPLPQESAPPRIELPVGEGAKPKPGGPTTEVKSVVFTGNTLFDASALTSALGEISGQRYDLAGLRGLADRIVEFYRAQGYPFTQTFLPPQGLKDGVLTIQVLEGRYGKIVAKSGERVPKGAQGFLSNLLHPDDPIANKDLERTMLLLDDQPGLKIAPSISPGEKVGTGDLTVDVARQSYVSGQAGVDNIGSRYTGAYRARGTRTHPLSLCGANDYIVAAIPSTGC